MVRRIIVQTPEDYNEGVRRMFFFIIFVFIPVMLIVIGSTLDVNQMIWMGIVWLGLVIYFKVIRKGLKKTRKTYGGGWKKIDRLPSWAFKKMKRRKTNKVNGDHYQYMRKAGRYYRKKK